MLLLSLNEVKRIVRYPQNNLWQIITSVLGQLAALCSRLKGREKTVPKGGEEGVGQSSLGQQGGSKDEDGGGRSLARGYTVRPRLADAAILGQVHGRGSVVAGTMDTTALDALLLIQEMLNGCGHVVYV